MLCVNFESKDIIGILSDGVSGPGWLFLILVQLIYLLFPLNHVIPLQKHSIAKSNMMQPLPHKWFLVGEKAEWCMLDCILDSIFATLTVGKWPLVYFIMLEDEWDHTGIRFFKITSLNGRIELLKEDMAIWYQCMHACKILLIIDQLVWVIDMVGLLLQGDGILIIWCQGTANLLDWFLMAWIYEPWHEFKF